MPELLATKTNDHGSEFPYNHSFMRVLGILRASLLLVASVCVAQSPPQTQQPAPSSPNQALHQKLEEFKAQYGKAQIPANGSNEVVLQPKPGTRTVSATGDARAIYNSIGSAFGIRFTFDESTPNRSARFELKDADFATAMTTAELMTKTFWIPVEKDRVLVAADNQQKRRDLTPMLERTFYLSDATSATDLQDIVNLMRTIFEVRYIVHQAGSNSITIRAEQRTIHQIEELLQGFDLSRPQVMLEIEAFEVDSSVQRNLGINLPLQFQMFNIPSGVLALLRTPGIQDIINQLAQSGGLSGLNNPTIAALLGQYQNQLQSLLANPVATFGGGLTFMGIGVPPGSVNASRNESRVVNLDKLSLQVAQGNPATIHIGNRYPVLTQSFSSGLSVTGVDIGVVGAVPGFTYEDLGITLKTKPIIHGREAVTLDAEMSIKSLGSASLNNIPIIQNREYKGTITVKEGEPAVIAGLISKTEQKSLTGPPGIGSLPVLNRLFSDETTNDERTELIVIITPHITRVRQTELTPIISAD